jgi:hypothetical protein
MVITCVKRDRVRVKRYSIPEAAGRLVKNGKSGHPLLLEGWLDRKERLLDVDTSEPYSWFVKSLVKFQRELQASGRPSMPLGEQWWSQIR